MDIEKRPIRNGFAEYAYKPADRLAAEYLRRAQENVMLAFLLGKDSVHCWRKWSVQVSLVDGVLRVVAGDDRRARRALEDAACYLAGEFSMIEEAYR